MKIVLIGPGYMPIPPNGWGAVEGLIWDYYENLKKRGQDVEIVNTTQLNQIVEICNSCNPDIVHIMYDDYITIVPHLTCSRILYTSHYAYITNPDFEQKYSFYFHNFFKKVIEYQDRITIHSISPLITDVYRKYGFTGKIVDICNGAREDSFHYVTNPEKGNYSVYLAKIEHRKGQYKYQTIPNIHFVGNYHSSPLDKTQSYYLGEWDKPTLYANLTQYGNLILLSEGEADPLVVKEALIAGLGVVVSECSSANLDISREFITVIPDDKLMDLEYVEKKITENRSYSVSHRESIREYALANFSWSKIIDVYLKELDATNNISIEIVETMDVNIEPHMKIALVGPGIMPIPPRGWGAVEILIWDYYQELTRMGHIVNIINLIQKGWSDKSSPNSSYCQKLIRMINSGNYDFVHIHYDCFYHIIPYLTCKKVGITSHYPYIDQFKKHAMDGYDSIFKGICLNHKHTIFALSQKDYDTFYLNAINKDTIYLTLNGANSSEIVAIDPLERSHIDKSIYLGKVEERKQQYKYCGIPGIDFFGKCENANFAKKECYKGQPERKELVSKLSQYGNMVLLSIGENGTPLVIKEALMAGLPIVTNKYSANDLDIDLPFIDIIPDDKLGDIPYIESVIIKNREKSGMWKEIREYAISNFSWKTLVKKYITFVK